MKIILDGVVDITIRIDRATSPTAKRRQKESAIVRHYAALGDKWITELKRSEHVHSGEKWRYLFFLHGFLQFQFRFGAGHR